MRKLLASAVAAIGAGAVGLSSTAEAHWYGPGWGWGPAPFVASAIVGGAVAAAATAPYYQPYRYYGYYAPACQPVWKGYNWVRACY
jgi:hypothetical protein